MAPPARIDGVAKPHRPSLWTKPTAHRNTLAAEKKEKIWSIGSVDGKEEDGLVEKSVAEAMAGVEPSARSRKSSYSLRFFKEGMPAEDKTRRKELKTPKEKLAPTLEEDIPAKQTLPKTTSQEPTAVRLRHDDWDVPLLTPRTPSAPSQIQDEQSIFIPSSKEDYFSFPTDGSVHESKPLASWHIHDQEAAKPMETSDSVGPTPALDADADGEAERVEARRKSDDSAVHTEVGSHDGDADESGEEKISSAVFLPHKELPEEPCLVDVQNRVRLRSPSQSKQHPWLVKADEPEPEIEAAVKDEPPYGLSRFPSRESLASRRGELVAEKLEEFVIEDEFEVKPVAPKPSQAVTQYEDHVHEHQHQHQHQGEEQPREPLEAIELIPYKHQVGGHTTLWRFSRRAVCKQLNNRENEFYETIERYHRDLLPFLPRYVVSRLSDSSCLCVSCSKSQTNSLQLHRRLERKVSQTDSPEEYFEKGRGCCRRAQKGQRASQGHS